MSFADAGTSVGGAAISPPTSGIAPGEQLNCQAPPPYNPKMRSQSNQPALAGSSRATIVAALVLAGIALVTFAPALDCDFVNLDDPDYVYENPHVTAGLNATTIRWAFTDYKTYYWHPLTWLSLQLDATLWRKADGRPDPWGFHLTNILVHAINTALLFVALQALTGAFWRAAAVSLLFAVHPLRVESVAWIAERKDVLSAGFGLLALWAYACYVRRPSPGRYAGLAAAFALSLVCKPTLVTLPCLFLVLDWWPLRRIRSVADWRWPVVEKLPLFALVIASAIVTLLGQSQAKAVMSLETFPLLPRLGHVAVSYVMYLSKTFWPMGLAVYYPHPTTDYGGPGVSPWQASGSIALLLAVTAGTAALWRRAPYLLTGWLWYLGTLVPVIGFVQVGTHAYADRFTYFPQIGILFGVCWGVAELGRSRPRTALAAAAAMALLLTALSREQLPVWQNKDTLWDQDLRVAHASPIGISNLILRPEKYDEAIRLLREAIRRNPNNAEARTQLGEILLRQGKLDEAASLEQEAVDLNPKLSGGWCNLGLAEAARHNDARAAECFRKALELRPDFPAAHTGLGDVLLRLGHEKEGMAELRKAIRDNPRFMEGYVHLGAALQARKDWDAAAGVFEQATSHFPKLPNFWFSLGNARAKQEQWSEAVKCFKRATELDPNSARYRRALQDAFQH